MTLTCDDLPPSTKQILELVEQYDSDSIDYKTVLDEADLPAPTVSNALADLEAAGIIERKPGLPDPRRTIVWVKQSDGN